MTRPDLTRRAVLGVLGGGAAATVLAGCGNDDTASASGGTSSASGGASTAKDAPSAGGSSSGGAAGGGTSGASPLVATADVPVGSGVILNGPKVVVTQPSKGTFAAFSAICTHQGCTVGTVSGDKILCPCHGSVFSVKDGSVLGGPAPSPLPAVDVSVKSGQVVRG